MSAILTTLCYIEKDEKYLMLHRVKKKNDLNKDKWIGVGGKFEPGETPEECLLREVMEETGLIDGLGNRDLHQIAGAMGNVLEEVTIEMHPVIADIKKCMLEHGALGAMMSGSGPTAFGIYDDKNKIRTAMSKIKKRGLAKQIYIANVHNTSEYSSLKNNSKNEAGLV